jgi:hypothetical protein
MWLLSPSSPNRVGRAIDVEVRLQAPLLSRVAFVVTQEPGRGWSARPVETASLVVRRGADAVTPRADGSIVLRTADLMIADGLAFVFVDASDRPIDQDEIAAAPRMRFRPSPPQRRIAVEPLERGLRLSDGGAVVEIDASRQRLDVSLPDGERWELGASWAGLAELAKLVADELPEADMPYEPGDGLADVVLAALRRGAGDARDPRIEQAVADLRPTPVVLSRPFLQQRWLQDDVVRFRPARIAVAYAEDEAQDNDPTPEGAERLVERLTSWRNLYAPSGKATSVLNRTLHRFGDDAAAAALWGLRRVALRSVPKSLIHVEVLGWLGAHPDACRLEWQQESVARASENELGEALVILDEGELQGRMNEPVAELLAELLASLDLDAPAPFPRLFADALYVWQQRLPLLTETALPPVPLPADPRITFLPNLAAVFAEGAAMGHCVAMRGPSAVAGSAFLFHAEDRYGQATVQVDPRGRVVEARGPYNTANATARWARLELEQWGRNFWVVHAGPLGASTLRGAPPLPAARRPLRDVRACFEAYRRLTDELPDHGLLAPWFLQYVRAATAGQAFLVEREESLGVEVLDAAGAVIGRSRDFGFGEAEDDP